MEDNLVVLGFYYGQNVMVGETIQLFLYSFFIQHLLFLGGKGPFEISRKLQFKPCNEILYTPVAQGSLCILANSAHFPLDCRVFGSLCRINRQLSGALKKKKIVLILTVGKEEENP